MPRQILSEEHIHETIREKVARHHHTIVEEVVAAISAHRVVVVGMAQNPFPKRARKALDKKGVTYHYLEYGNYLNTWRRRTALKMWTGWPTFPMVFVDGTLIGGATELEAFIEKGTLDEILKTERSA